jgi:Domain of unknown function (DUF5134)
VTIPLWLYYLFAALMLAVAAYSLVLLVFTVAGHRPAGWDVDVAHVLMGVAMAGMFIVDWAFGSREVWEVIFGVLLAWFVVCATVSVRRYGFHRSHYLIHAVMSLAMLLMYAYPRGVSEAMSGSMAGMSMSMPVASRLDPGLSFLLAVVILTSAVFTLASANKGASHHGSHPPAFAFSGAPRAEVPSYGQGGSVVVGIERSITTPWLEDVSHVVMCVGMGFLLILMI